MREDRLPEPRPPGPPLAELTLRPVVPALCLAEVHHLSGTSACSTPTAISFGAKFGSSPFSRICGVYRQGHLSSLMSPRNFTVVAKGTQSPGLPSSPTREVTTTPLLSASKATVNHTLRPLPWSYFWILWHVLWKVLEKT